MKEFIQPIRLEAYSLQHEAKFYSNEQIKTYQVNLKNGINGHQKLMGKDGRIIISENPGFIDLNTGSEREYKFFGYRLWDRMGHRAGCQFDK
jgi:hypothetical protein